MPNNFYIGNNPIKPSEVKVEGSFLEIGGEVFYKIENYDAMRPFFMTVVSSSDHWLFLSSNGGITAGRRSSDSALFPYYTDDKIIDSAETTGSRTIFQVLKDEAGYIYEPFSDRNIGVYSISRNIYKNRIGNKVLFEEENQDLQLRFSYLLTFSDDLGFIKKSSLTNLSNNSVVVELVDGIQNILPYGINEDLQVRRSTLADAYKKCELDSYYGLGIYSLSAMIVDKAEPSESLQATIAWQIGLEVKNYLLSSRQLDAFRIGQSIKPETDIRAERGAYFVNSTLDLEKGVEKTWYIVADVNQNASSITSLKELINSQEVLIDKIEDGITKNTENLIKKVALSDGLQLTKDQLSVGRHFSNVLFNIMRGGVFEDQYTVDGQDLRDYVHTVNPIVGERNTELLEGLGSDITYNKLIITAREISDLDLSRIIYEYLPLSFSRRHGDPSRPWNKFTIDTNDENGNSVKYYEGNWRDIFQNWEALAMSFPKFLEGMITKFVNASTIDGYNPYRITRDGIDWEVIEPDDPWSFIGYWGDHQLIYLLKLLELSDKYNPGELAQLFVSPINVYANVPYRIKTYNELLVNPSDTVDFDHSIESEVNELQNKFGADSKIVYARTESPVRANLTEKILVSVLTKLYNLVPGAGIWLNTQRPEWNDANNALVGNGTSMVTLFYLRRFLQFLLDQAKQQEAKTVELNTPVATLLREVTTILKANQSLLLNSLTNTQTRSIMDSLGHAGENYRSTAYEGFSGDTEEISFGEIAELCEIATNYTDYSINVNKREDGLYHAYNLISTETDQVITEHLYEMLEGQVAALSAGYLDAQESLRLLDNLKKSDLYREDQYSYLLYPDRTLPLFVERNNVPSSLIENSELAKLLRDNKEQSILTWDTNNVCHFNSHFNNSADLELALKSLSQDENYTTAVAAEYDSYLAIFEEVFNHKAFTGRSGTFYGYEGLGSIYWHMVSKLLLATQECIIEAIHNKENKELVGQLIEHYYEIRAGIGINKTPDVYGAFPTDAYSHTPGHAGVQQPGMTGQVKEDIISRWAELGIYVSEGQIEFSPDFLNQTEYLDKATSFDYYNTTNDRCNIEIEANSLVFTYCQVPIIYIKSKDEQIVVSYSNGNEVTISGNRLSSEISSEILERKGTIQMVKVFISS